MVRVGDLERSKAFLGALGFKLKYEYEGAAGWSNRKTLFWIGEADAQGKKRRHRTGNIGFHHYAFELSKRRDVDDFYEALKKLDVAVVDPPGDYYEGGYYALYFLDPDGMRLEAKVFDPAGLARHQEARGKSTQAAIREHRGYGMNSLGPMSGPDPTVLTYFLQLTLLRSECH